MQASFVLANYLQQPNNGQQLLGRVRDLAEAVIAVAAWMLVQVPLVIILCVIEDPVASC